MNKLLRQKKNSILAILAVVIVVLAASFIIFRNQGQEVEAGWFDETWYYRQSSALTNSSSTDVTNQYVKVAVDTATLITADKMQTDCDDLRITNVNGDLLPFFIDGDTEYDCNDSDTAVWVMVDNIPTSGSTIYLYYGNSSADNGEINIGTTEYPSISCRSILEHGDSSGDGQYYITSTGNKADKFEVTCNMTKDLGGWIKVYDGLCTSATSVTRNTGTNVEISNNIPFNNMIIEAQNWNLSETGTTTETALMSQTFSWYFDWVHDEPDSPNPDVKFHDIDGNQDVQFQTLARMLRGYGNSWRQIINGEYNTTDHDSYMYLGGLGGHGINQLEWNGSNYNSTMNNTSPEESGLGLTPWKFQEIYVWVREDNITLNQSDQSAGTPASEEQGPGPVAYWNFDEGYGSTTYDQTPNNNDGTITGATWKPESECKFGRCLYFDGSDDVVSVGTDNFGSTKGTVSLWVKPTGAIPSNSMLFGHQNGGNRLYVGINSTPAINIGIADSGAINVNQNLILNEWQHISFSYDSGTWIFYYNGQQISTGSYSGSISFAATAEIADDGGSGWTNNFPGFFDEVKIYPYARTADQMKQDYNRGKAVMLGQNEYASLNDGLVGYWKMDENVWNGTIGEVIDSSGNGNHGTSTNAIVTSTARFGNAGYMDGIDDYFTFADSNDFDISEEISIGMWVKGNGTTTVNLLDVYGIDWTNSNSWTKSTTGTSLGWDATESALKAVSYYNMYTTQKIPIDTSKGYFVQYDVKTKANAGKGLYGGTHSYATIDGSWLPGHPGSYDYFVDSYGTFIEDTWYFRRNNIISGAIRTGESDVTSNRAVWHTGTEYATIMFLANYSGTTAQEIYIKNLNINSVESEFGRPNSYGLSFDDDSFSGVINDERIEADMTSGQWNHIMMTYNMNEKNNQQKLFLNGELVAQGNLDQAIEINTNDFLMFFNGEVDDARLYNRALLPDEVRHLYEWAPGPVAHWKFDESMGTTAYDVSGNNNTSTQWNGTPIWNCGKFGSALDFDGSGVSGIEISSPSGFDTSAFTAEVWIDGTSQDGVTRILNYGSSGLNHGGFLIGQNTDGTLRTYIDRDGTGNWDYLSSTGVVNDGNWHHLALVYDGVNRFIYIDGIKDLSTDIPSTYNQSPANPVFTIGQSTYDSEEHEGRIDDVRIYNYARTSRQILEDMNAGKKNNPIGYWSFDEGQGTTTYDSGVTKQTTGSGNDGTLTNMSTSGTSTAWTEFGKTGRAIKFDGNNDYIELANPTTFNFDAPATIGAWVKMNGDNSGSNILFSLGDKDTSGQNEQYVIIGNYTGTWSDEVIGTVRNVGGSSQYNLAARESTGTNLFDNKWHYITVRYNGSEVSIYLDGEEQITTLASGTNNGSYGGLSNIDSAKIGVLDRPTDYGYFDGVIDEFKLYNYALTLDEIRQNYNQGKQIVLSKSKEEVQNSAEGLVGHWKMDESSWSGASNEIRDYSGREKHASRSGDASTTSTAKYGRAGTFDGTGDYVEINAALETGLNLRTETISYWFNPTSVSPTSREYIYAVLSSVSGDGANPDLSTHNRGGVWINSSNELMIARSSWNDAGGWCQTTYNNGITIPNLTIASDTWYFVTEVWDYPKGEVRLYINGEEYYYDNGLNKECGDLDDNYFWIGRHKGSSSYDDFTGQIDDIKIYNYARTSEQIMRDYTEGPSPVAHWKIDEKTGDTVYDNSGRGNSGTVTNATWKSATDCQVGSCLEFDGDGDYIDNGVLGDLKNNFSFSMWMNPALGNSASFPIAYQNGGDSTSLQFRIEYAQSTPDIMQFGMYINGATTELTAQQALIPGSWNHVVGTYDGSTMKLYIDGSLDNSKSQTGIPVYSNSRLVLGARYTGSYNTEWAGFIDEVKIFDYALTPRQVAQEYSGGDPVGYWKFDKGEGGTAYDYSGNSNNGTIYPGTGGTNTSTSTMWSNGSNGKINGSMDFDDTDDEINIDDNTDLQITDELTVCAWVYSSITSGNAGVFEKTVGGAVNTSYLLFADTTKYNFRVDMSGTQTIGSLKTLTDLKDTWAHLCGSYSKSNNGRLSIYVNGVEDNYSNITANSIDTGSGISYIGMLGGSIYPFNGQIDEVKVWNYALTPEDIIREYNGGFSSYFK